jgi:NADH-quinone oxidoreductase subunit L
MLITVICICLFIGAMGKSAQFPLHVWLPDSMEGPTPISALIHAATMVTAGIFMVARMSPLFELSDTALNFILVIGAITALFMGFLGIIQNDIKRVVAYSTLSQLGYMTVALGASAYSVAVFHLMTHAFFKALLFLGAGSVIMGMHHNQDIRWMGGVRKYMPITWITSLLGSLALIGTPLFSGFYSKDSIIEAVHFSQLPAAGFAHFAVLAGVFITAFYSFRMYFLVFHGKERYDQNPSRQRACGRGEKSMTLTLGHFLSLGAMLFALAVIGIFLNRKNLIVLLMAIELMLLAVNMNFVAFSHYLGDMHGQVFVFFILTVAAAESAIGLAILVLLFRNNSSINAEDLNTLKG